MYLPFTVVTRFSEIHCGKKAAAEPFCLGRIKMETVTGNSPVPSLSLKGAPREIKPQEMLFMLKQSIQPLKTTNQIGKTFPMSFSENTLY